jgi:hypothetical protein
MTRCTLPVVLATGLLGCDFSPDVARFPGDVDPEYVDDIAFATSDADTATGTTDTGDDDDDLDDFGDTDTTGDAEHAPQGDITAEPVALQDAGDPAPPWCAGPPEPLCAAA